jgi:hypothetical protein
MEDIVLYVVGAAVIVIFIIVLNHKKQKNTVNSFLKDAEEMQPIFLVKAVEKKLQNLYTALYEDGIKPGVSENAMPAKAINRKQALVQELEQLEKDYSSKKISLANYSDKLHTLQMKVNKL